MEQQRDLAPLIILMFVVPCVLAVIGVLSFYSAISELCGTDSSLREIPNPQNTRVAVVYERNCGAMDSFHMNVSIVRPGNSFSHEAQASNVLIAGVNHLDVRWLSNQSLEITVPAAGRIERQDTSVDGVTISYR